MTLSGPGPVSSWGDLTHRSSYLPAQVLNPMQGGTRLHRTEGGQTLQAAGKGLFLL